MKKALKNIDLLGKTLFALLIILSSAGYFLKLYQMFFWWDLMLHFISGTCFVSIGLGIARYVPNLKLSHMLLFGFMFAITTHAIWELYEFICDIAFNFNMQRWRFDPTMPDTYGKIISIRTPGVIDTMTDFIANVTGAVLMCLSYAFHFAHSKKM